MMKVLSQISIAVVVAVVWLPALAGQGWEILENCRLVPHSSNDGDSFRVEHHGETYLFRLYLVDAPEDRMSYPKRVKEQADYFGINTEDALAYADEASRETKKFLSRRFIIYTQWIDARGMSQVPRYYALAVNSDDQYLDTHLVGLGLARIYGMPIRGGDWPGRRSKDRHVRELKKAEARAKRRGLGGWQRSRHETETAEASPEAAAESGADGGQIAGLESPIDPNLADSATLQSVPGIGPVYAKRIIENRPFKSVADLTRVKGIGASTLTRIESYFYVEPPPAPEGTADYFLQDLDRWLNQIVTVRVRAAKAIDEPAPDGFAVLEIETGTADSAHGTMRTYLPRDELSRALDLFQEPLQPFTALLFDIESHGPVLIVQRRE
jgi:competence protein ComEA